MLDFRIRCSSVGHIMSDPVSIDASLRTPEVEAILKKKVRTDDEKALIKRLKQGQLSEGAKTYIRRLVSQEIFGVTFEVSSKAIAKGLECEEASIALLNRVRGLSLAKNTERRTNRWLTGECDLFNAPRRAGHDLKTSWSLATFPILPVDCEDQLYFFQMQGYMDLWDADEWSVDYAMVDTPERLIGYEPMELHIVSHIPENLRLTSWVVKRDQSVIDLMHAKVEAAQTYAREVLREFDRAHAIKALADAGAPWASDASTLPQKPTAPAAVPKTAAPVALPELF